MIDQLQQLGLSEKEAKVYLASLELGSSAVQEIARKAGVNRPTTYVQIESLMKRGLMSSVTRGKKRYFGAESPEQLIRLLETKEKEIKNKKEGFKKFLPELKTIFDLSEEKPKVRFFEGREGFKSMQRDVLLTETDTLEEFIPLDDAYKVFPPSPEDHRSKVDKKFKDIKRRIIYTSKKGDILPSGGNEEVSFISPEEFPFNTEIVIYGPKVALLSYKGKLIGVIIENKEIANSLKSIFNLAWKATSKK